MPDAVEIFSHQHAEFDPLFEKISDPGSDRRAVLNEILQKMAAHVSVERSLLFPEIQRHGIGGKRLAKEFRTDYRKIGRLLVLIERRKVNSPDEPELVTELIDVFNQHRQRFDAGVAPKLAQALGPEKLDDLGARAMSAEGVILSHPHPHLLSLGPLSRLTTRCAALIDRARDRSVTNG